MFYYRGLQQWPAIREYLRDTCLTAQDNYKALLDYFRILYSPPRGGGQIKPQIHVNHGFTGIFIWTEMQKKASKSGLSVAYSVYIPRTDNAVSDNENSYDSI